MRPQKTTATSVLRVRPHLPESDLIFLRVRPHYHVSQIRAPYHTAAVQMSHQWFTDKLTPRGTCTYPRGTFKILFPYLSPYLCRRDIALKLWLAQDMYSRYKRGKSRCQSRTIHVCLINVKCGYTVQQYHYQNTLVGLSLRF